MKKAFWLLALGALASAIMAASLGRAEEASGKDGRDGASPSSRSSGRHD